MKGYGGGGYGCVAPLILNLGRKWWRMINATPRPLYPRDGTSVSIVEGTECASGPVLTVLELGRSLAFYIHVTVHRGKFPYNKTN
jgi:hypothetical protein